jgi:OOP family OmpA-OmpF porin
MKKALIACALCAAAISPALAAGPYLGLGVNVTDQAGDFKTKSTLKLRGGYDFNDTWGVEAGVYGVPHFDAFDGRLNPLGKASGRTMYLAGKATMPISEKFALVTKLGLAHTRLKFDDAGLPAAGAFGSSNTAGLYAAIGLKYALTDKTSLTFELERNGRNSRHVRNGVKPEMISVNVNRSF